MRTLLSCYFFFVVAFLSAQAVYNVREVLTFTPGVSSAGGQVYVKLPRDEAAQSVTQLRFDPAPTAAPLADDAAREYRWDLGATPPDSLAIRYRLTVASLPAWATDSLDRPGAGFRWPDTPAVTVPYVLPPLVRDDVQRTEFASLDPADTTVAAIGKLIDRIGRRIKSVRELDGFDYAQPLLKDVYQRRTTPRRKHLLLSLALQYLDVPHRLVSGKVLSYGMLQENELWVEIPVNGRYHRVYYGDGIDRGDWGPPDEPDQFVVCSYDWRDYTLEVVNAPEAPAIPTQLDATFSNVVIDLWVAKDEALSRKRYAVAMANLDSIRQLAPRNVVVIAEMGLVFTQAGRAEEGVKYLQAALNQAVAAADRATVLVQFGKYYSLLEQPEQALKAVARAYGTYPSIDLSVIYTDPRFQFLARQARVEERITAYLRQQQAGN